MKRYNSYTYGEAQTGIGQVISFSCGTDDKDEIKRFIEEKVRGIEMPVIHKTNVSHGGYGRYSRYEIVQHKYAGGRGGFIEMIEIKNAPDNRHPFVIFEYGDGSRFSEWESIEDGQKAWEKIWGYRRPEKELVSLPGFKRLVRCGALTPWFYAIGDEMLLGDYAIQPGVEDDPVFRLGRKFVVEEENGCSVVKTCMGSRYYTGESSYDSHKTEEWRLVYFDDGTTLRILKNDKLESTTWLVSDQKKAPRPLQDKEAWITEAMEQFQKLLSGQKEGFQIKFADGSTFTGKLSPKGKRIPSTEGRYELEVTMGDGEIRKGWLEFSPTTEHPDIVAYIKSRSAKKVEKVVIKKVTPKAGGKKWSGAFFIASQ